MNLVRTLNVITLSLLLILTGCFGLIDDEDDPIDDAEGQTTPDGDGTTTSVSSNQAPVVEGMTTSDIHLEYDTMFLCDGKRFQLIINGFSKLNISSVNWKYCFRW